MDVAEVSVIIKAAGVALNVPNNIAEQSGVEEKYPVLSVIAQAPADTFPIADTMASSFSVIAEEL
jgi:hypothetical protein